MYRSTHILLVALAVSDICFSLAIHPMLVVTSFGVPSEDLFGHSGECDDQTISCLLHLHPLYGRALTFKRNF